MNCFVYKGSNKADYYLYLPHQHDDVPEPLPAAILDLMGELSLVLEFELAADRELAQADAGQVIRDIEEQGFYLQMPKKDMLAEEDRYFN